LREQIKGGLAFDQKENRSGTKVEKGSKEVLTKTKRTVLTPLKQPRIHLKEEGKKARMAPIKPWRQRQKRRGKGGARHIGQRGGTLKVFPRAKIINGSDLIWEGKARFPKLGRRGGRRKNEPENFKVRALRSCPLAVGKKVRKTRIRKGYLKQKGRRGTKRGGMTEQEGKKKEQFWRISCVDEGLNSAGT